MAVTIKKIKTYYCEGLVDGWVDVKDNGEIEVYGFDYSKYTIDQIKDLSLFLQYVYEDNEVYKKFEQENKWVDLTQEESEHEPWVKTYFDGKPNYTTPFECPRCGRCREWVGLTEQDVHDAFQFTELVKQLSFSRERPEWCENFAAYVEAKLKEKNT